MFIRDCCQEGWSGVRPSCELQDLRVSQSDQTEEKAEEHPVSLGNTAGPAMIENHSNTQIILAILLIVRAL